MRCHPPPPHLSVSLYVHLQLVLTDRSSPAELPVNEYFSYFGPDYELDVPASNQEDFNTPEYLAKIKAAIFEQMRDKTAVPSVGMQGAAQRLTRSLLLVEGGQLTLGAETLAFVRFGRHPGDADGRRRRECRRGRG